MDTVIEENYIAYLYQLSDGLSGTSLAYHVAAVAHIPVPIITRGKEVIPKITTKTC